MNWFHFALNYSNKTNLFLSPMVVNVSSHSVELARMEACLDENPDFFQDYLIRKASRQMIDSWLVAHSLPPGHTHPLSPRSEDGTDLNPSTPMSRFVYILQNEK